MCPPVPSRLCARAVPLQIGWGMVKGLLDPRTVAKIEIMGAPSEWQPRFRALFDEETLPTEYGGKMVIPGGLVRPRSVAPPCARALSWCCYAHSLSRSSCSATKKFHLPTGRVVHYAAPVEAGQGVRFKWLCHPGGACVCGRPLLRARSGNPGTRRSAYPLPQMSGLPSLSCLARRRQIAARSRH